MTPVPTIVTLRISLLFAIRFSLLELTKCFPNFSNSVARGCSSTRSLGGASFLVGSVMIYDQARSPLPRDIGPNPLEENRQAKARRRQKLEVHGCPSEPSPEPANLHFATLQYCKSLAHNGHSSFVKVAEGIGRTLSRYKVMNHLRRVASLLHCYLRNTCQRLAVLIERRSITHDKNLDMPRHREIFLNSHAASAVRLDV